MPGIGAYREIKLSVKYFGVKTHRINIYFVGGKKHQADINRFFEAGSETDPVDLTGTCSPIHRVVIDYYVRAKKKAVLQLWGRI